MFRAIWIAALLAATGVTMARAEPASVQDYMRQPRIAPTTRIAYGPAAAQVGELFLPNGKGPHPVVVLIHGGCFLAEYEGLPQTSAMAADLARRGYAVWNLEYRKLGEAGAGYPGTFLDVADGLDHLRKAATTYGLDLTRIVAVGHSAGGHLALWAAGRARLPEGSPLWRADPLLPGAVVSLGGIGDLERQGDVFAGACGPVIPRIIDTAGRAKPYGDTSPAALLPLSGPVTMISGAFDHVMPPFTGRAFVQTVRAAGGAAEVIAVPDAGHFDVVMPGGPAWEAVVRAIDARFAALRR